MSTFGERVAKLRHQLGYSQRELAELLTISKSTLSMYEKNNREPDFEMLVRIADLFDVSTDYLLARETESTTVRFSPELLDEFKTLLHQLDNTPLTDLQLRYLQVPLSATMRIMHTIFEGRLHEH